MIASLTAAGALGLGVLLFSQGRPVAPPPQATGAISLLVSDSAIEARVSAYLSLATFEHPLADAPISIRVRLDGRPSELVSWAVVFTGDFGFNWSDPMADSAEPKTQYRAPDAIWVRGATDTAYFRNAGFLVGSYPPTPNMLGSVVIGRSVLENGTAEFDVTTPASRPIAAEAGGDVVLNLPVMGLPFSQPTLFSQRDNKTAAVSPQSLAVGTAGEDRTPGGLRSQLESPTWWFPRPANYEIQVDRDTDNQRLANSVPAPLSVRDWIWEGQDRLEVEATIHDPSKQATRDSLVFLSGVVLGIAGGALVWLLDLVREAVRSRTGSRKQPVGDPSEDPG